MRLVGINGGKWKPAEGPRKADRPADERPEPSRALVALTPTAAQPAAASHRPAAFLAHLIATHEQVPQLRERRRAEPAEAIAAYRATALR